MIRQAELEALILYAFHEYYQSGSERLELHQVSSLLSVDVTDARIELALKALSVNSWIHIDYPFVSTQPTRYSLTDEGYKYAEELLERGEGRVDSDDTTLKAPASDRIVGFDHNSSEFRQIAEASDALRTGLINANDTGDLSPRAVEVAVQEVESLNEALRRDFIRPSHVWQMAKSSLRWIADHAAGAAVGQAALALLALIAAFFGIVF